MEADIHFLILT